MAVVVARVVCECRLYVSCVVEWKKKRRRAAAAREDKDKTRNDIELACSRLGGAIDTPR